MRLRSGGKLSIKVCAVSVALTALATPAFAEGSWTGTVEAVYPGFGSRTWTDKNSDSASNYAQIHSCDRGATIAIYRNRQWPVPDEVVGSEASTCNNRVSYRAGTKGDIHFTVKSTEGGGELWGSVAVGY